MFKKYSITFTMLFCFFISYNSYSKEAKIIWASEVLGNSSQQNEFSAIQILGKPNITSAFAITDKKSDCAWSPNFSKNNEQWIIIGFDTNIITNAIYIHENINPGAITIVDVFTQNNTTIRVYSDNFPQITTQEGRILRIQLEKEIEDIKAIKIEVNSMHYYERPYQIDAVGISNELFNYDVKIYETVDTLTQKAERLSDNINSPFPELAPVISPSGNILYFTRSSDYEGLENSNLQDIYYSLKDENGKFMKAVNIGKPLNNKQNNYMIAILPDENQVLVGGSYFQDSSESIDFAISTFDGINWKYPKKIRIDDYYNYLGEGSYCIAPSGKVMMFSIAASNNRGSHDLYTSFIKEDGSWTSPINLGDDINTAADEITPYIASDGKTLYFSTTGRPGYGGYDVFMSERLDSTWTKWSKPKNLGHRINSSGWNAYYTIDARGEYAFFIADEDNSRNTDIYKIALQKEARPKPVALINGKVLDKKTGLPVKAKILYELLNSGKNIGTAISNKTTGEYKIILPSGGNYGLLAKAEGYFAINQNIDLTNLDTYKEINRDIILIPIEENQIFRLNNIFFEFSKYELLANSFSELNRVIDLLQNNPNMIISVNGHTDNIGSYKKNQLLSLQRADAVTKYLVDMGIEKNRIHINGYGAMRPIHSNKTEKGRKQNRRVEFKIISK